MIDSNRRYYDIIQYVESGDEQEDVSHHELGHGGTIEMAMFSPVSSFHCQPKELDIRNINL